MNVNRHPWGHWLALMLLLLAVAAAHAQPGRDQGEYQILQARYGTAERNVDVTQRLRELARADQPFRMGNDTFGVDPDEGRIKTLRIYARGPRGEERIFEYREGSVIDGAQFSGWRRGDWGGGGGGGWDRGGPPPRMERIEVVRAIYGAGRRAFDVTERLNAVLARDGRIDTIVNNDSMGGDPAEHEPKVLDLTWRDDRGERRVQIYERGRLRLP